MSSDQLTFDEAAYLIARLESDDTRMGRSVTRALIVMMRAYEGNSVHHNRVLPSTAIRERVSFWCRRLWIIDEQKSRRRQREHAEMNHLPPPVWLESISQKWPKEDT